MDKVILITGTSTGFGERRRKHVEPDEGPIFDPPIIPSWYSDLRRMQFPDCIRAEARELIVSSAR